MRLLFSTLFLAAGALIGVVPGTRHTAAANNRPKDVKVMVSFHDLAGDRIVSDGFGSYENGVGGVVAYIAASQNGALIFGTNTSNKPGRTLQYFFDDCLLSLANCNAPWPSLNEHSGLLANVLRGGVVPQGGLMAMTTTEGELPAWIKFNIPLDSDPAY